MAPAGIERGPWRTNGNSWWLAAHASGRFAAGVIRNLLGGPHAVIGKVVPGKVIRGPRGHRPLRRSHMGAGVMVKAGCTGMGSGTGRNRWVIQT